MYAEDGDPLGVSCAIRSQNILLTGDDYGRISVFQYPCTASDSNPHASHTANSSKHFNALSSIDAAGFVVQRYAGHASTVSCIAVSDDGAYAVSAGEDDGCIVVWNLVRTPPRSEGTCAHLDGMIQHVTHIKNRPDLDAESGSNSAEVFAGDDDKRTGQNDDDEEQMMMGVYGEGDTLACVQQYVSWLLPPSDFDQAKDRAREGLNSLPEARLTIDHVYGYRYVFHTCIYPHTHTDYRSC